MKAFKVTALIGFILLCVFAVSLSFGQEPPGPFSHQQQPTLQLRVQVLDEQRVKAAALAILTTRYALSDEEALASLTTAGRLDLARCMEFILIDTLSASLAQALFVSEIDIVVSHEIGEPSP